MKAIKFNFMKKAILMMRAFCAAILVVFSLVGCEEADIYEIDAPVDLQARIDSIAAAKAGVDTGDTTYINIATAIVGAEDFSSPWWTDFSDYFAVPTGKMLTLEFINHNGGSADNFRNWVLVVTNEIADRDGEGYEEYFALRADAFGWGNGDFDLGLISQNYPDTDGNDDVWNDFRATMDGAYVTLEIDHSATGNVFVTATAVGTNGTELVMTYNQPVSATADINAFLVTDGSYFEMKRAYLLPSQVTAVEDFDPVSIEITGAPAIVEIGNENFWGNAIATVTFADGSSTQVDSADLSFTVVPDDMMVLGEKTVIVAYSKTKQGSFTQAVSTFYKLQVTNPVSSLEVTGMPDITTYYFFDSNPIIFNTKGIEVTATYSDGSTGVVENNTLQFGTIPAAEGTQTVDISYEGATSTITTTLPLTLIKGVAQVGATDFSTPWPTYSNEYTVASGSSTTVAMYCYSNNLNNYHSPSVAVGKAGNLNTDVVQADGAAAVVRMDNYGWGPGYEGVATATSDWNWDIFASNISGSYIEVTVTNKGDNTADIRYDVTYATGETHFQQYEGITVDSSDLNFALVLEGAYLVIVE